VIAHPGAAGDRPLPEFSAVRASFHIYNSHDDIERLMHALA
jgi:selenocysteine lyase/cysteine desulfurase